MLSPRGGGPHDDPTATSAAPASSSSSTRHTEMEDDDAGACGRVLEWERGLPTAEEVTPISHPLVPPALAAAFQIGVAGTGANAFFPSFDCCAVLAYDSPTSHLSFRCDEEEEEEEEDGFGDGEGEGEGESEDASACGGGGAGAGTGRAGKKARMVWTPELHHRFVEAVAHLGDKAAVPKAIVRLMNVDGLTRENVASHLQKYRIYLKRTRNHANAKPPQPQPPPPAFPPPAYGSHFRPQQPSDTFANRSDCAGAFSSRDDVKLERDK